MTYLYQMFVLVPHINKGCKKLKQKSRSIYLFMRISHRIAEFVWAHCVIILFHEALFFQAVQSFLLFSALCFFWMVPSKNSIACLSSVSFVWFSFSVDSLQSASGHKSVQVCNYNIFSLSIFQGFLKWMKIFIFSPALCVSSQVALRFDLSYEDKIEGRRSLKTMFLSSTAAAPWKYLFF